MFFFAGLTLRVNSVRPMPNVELFMRRVKDMESSTSGSVYFVNKSGLCNTFYPCASDGKSV